MCVHHFLEYVPSDNHSSLYFPITLTTNKGLHRLFIVARTHPLTQSLSHVSRGVENKTETFKLGQL